jgi:hypothetical protein
VLVIGIEEVLDRGALIERSNQCCLVVGAVELIVLDVSFVMVDKPNALIALALISKILDACGKDISSHPLPRDKKRLTWPPTSENRPQTFLGRGTMRTR